MVQVARVLCVSTGYSNNWDRKFPYNPRLLPKNTGKNLGLSQEISQPA